MCILVKVFTNSMAPCLNPTVQQPLQEITQTKPNTRLSHVILYDFFKYSSTLFSSQKVDIRVSQSVQSFSPVIQSCPSLSNPMDCSTPGFSVHHKLPEFAQTHVHRVSDDIQPSHPLFSPSPLAFSLSQHQGLFKWVSSSHQMAKILEFQLQHQSFQWIFRTDFL